MNLEGFGLPKSLSTKNLTSLTCDMERTNNLAPITRLRLNSN
jgi:hypothetical protein